MEIWALFYLCIAAEALVRSGVGHIRIIDGDSVEPTNINRQIPALHSTVGLRKVDVARHRLLDISPDCEVNTVDCFLEASNMEIAFSAFADGIFPLLVVDAIDSLTSKAELLAYCVKHGFPVVSSMGAARKRDPLAVRVDDISKTQVCPLARHLRKALRDRGVTQGVRCIYSVENAQGGTHEALDSGAPLRSKAMGSVMTVTGVFGLTAASEAMKYIMLNGWK